LKQVKYLCIEKSGVIIPENANFDSFYQEELVLFLAKQHNNDEFEYILAVTKSDAVFGAELASQYGLGLIIDGFLYNFREINLVKFSKEQQMRTLLKNAKEPSLFFAALDGLLNSIIKVVPLRYSVDDAQTLIVEAVPKNLIINKVFARKLATDKAKLFFDEKYNYIVDLTQPRQSKTVKKIKLSYKHELVEHIKAKPGLYVVNDKMGNGKSQDVILPLFNYYCSTDAKPILVSPTIALTKQLIEDARNYEYQKNNKLDGLAGLAACVISATTNWNFRKYSPKSTVTLVEEFEECEASICSKALMYPKQLSRVTEAMEHWLTLLQKETVVIADAMFSNFSALQLVKLGRNITIVENTDKGFVFEKELVIQPYEQHLQALVENLNNNKTCIAFCDGSHAYDGKYKNISKAVSQSTSIKSVTVDKNYIQEFGKNYLADIDKSISDYQFHLYSPVITSGISIVSNKVDSVNIFACQTLLPTQLLQSSGRCRKSKVINISFDLRERFSSITLCKIFDEEANDKYKLIPEYELNQLRKSPNCDRVLERIQHNRIMRRNYVHVSLTMFECMGYKITRVLDEKTLKENKKYLKQIKKLNQKEFIKLVEQINFDEFDYHFLKRAKFGLTSGELQNLEALRLLSFYKVTTPEDRGDIKKLVNFDDKAKARSALLNLNILHDNFCDEEEPKKAVLTKIFKDIFSILNICSSLFTAKYTDHDIDNLANYIRSSNVVVESKKYSVRKELLQLGCSTNISGEYENRGSLSQSLLKKLFKLRQVSKRYGAKDSQGQRPTEYYYLCLKQSKQIAYYFNRCFNPALIPDTHRISDVITSPPV
jgi:hypothetical protein